MVAWEIAAAGPFASQAFALLIGQSLIALLPTKAQKTGLDPPRFLRPKAT
jgi:hypothetical protein